MQAVESESIAPSQPAPVVEEPKPVDPLASVEQQATKAPEEDDEPSSSIWSSFTSSATASLKQAMETTGEAMEMTSDILSTAAEDAKKLTTGMVSDENSADNHQEDAEESESKSLSPNALMSSFKVGWSSMTSSVVEQTKASIKQAETVVEKSFESLDRASEISSSVVKNTTSSINKVVAEASGDGWLESSTPVPKEENEVVFEAEGDAVDKLGESGEKSDLFDFR